jgi:hypothetical protein
LTANYDARNSWQGHSYNVVAKGCLEMCAIVCGKRENGSPWCAMKGR